jgi:hypothetical protein
MPKHVAYICGALRAQSLGNAAPPDDVERRRPPQRAGATLQARRTAELRRLQRQRYAQRIWRLGDRVQFELVEKFIEHFGLDEEVARQILDRFAGLDPEMLRTLGVDKIPHLPLRAVGPR